jgi:hypothetical protein
MMIFYLIFTIGFELVKALCRYIIWIPNLPLTKNSYSFDQGRVLIMVSNHGIKLQLICCQSLLRQLLFFPHRRPWCPASPATTPHPPSRSVADSSLRHPHKFCPTCYPPILSMSITRQEKHHHNPSSRWSTPVIEEAHPQDRHPRVKKNTTTTPPPRLSPSPPTCLEFVRQWEEALLPTVQEKGIIWFALPRPWCHRSFELTRDA